MGQEIDHHSFHKRDFERFARCLRAETDLLHDLVECGGLSRQAPVAGLELEACLIDSRGQPAPRNEEFLQQLGLPEVVTELGRFDIEINVPPQPVHGRGLLDMAADLESIWSRCRATAATMGLQPVAIGILPTLTDDHLTLENLSHRARYRALNEQVQRQRHGRLTRLEIQGLDGEHLTSEHHDVMLEAGATSFQVHLQVSADRTVRTYNAALVASAPVVAVSVNSPLLFGRRLWLETRIPLFEQALNIGSREDGSAAAVPRVGFGSGYAGWSLVECFRENELRFEPLLPLELPESTGSMPHLRLHNGTIWRWNRPLVGFDDDGTPHLRVEHRPMAAGPTLHDMMANLAFSIGLVTTLASREMPPESALPFETAHRNFAAAARSGLRAKLTWIDGREWLAGELVRHLVDEARAGLAELQVDRGAADRWMQTILERAASERTGARWQLEQLESRRGSLAAMTLDYAARQAEGEPVHRWN
jgi:hypothetical protein